MKKTAISTSMAKALDTAAVHGGKLERLPGGYWTWPGCPRHKHDGTPHWHVGTTTIDALVDRGKMKFIEWKLGRRNQTRFPIAVEIVA